MKSKHSHDLLILDDASVELNNPYAPTSKAQVEPSLKRISYPKAMQWAKMIVPKMSCADENGYHVRWPKDHPKVIYAPTRDDLIVPLAKWLMEIGRVGNAGKHVPPENNCPTCR